MKADPIAQLRAEVGGAAAAIGDGATAPNLDRPPKADFGDYSTNAAMLLAPTLGDAPRAIAERLGTVLQTSGSAPPWSGWRWRGPASSTCS